MRPCASPLERSTRLPCRAWRGKLWQQPAVGLGHRDGPARFQAPCGLIVAPSPAVYSWPRSASAALALPRVPRRSEGPSLHLLLLVELDVRAYFALLPLSCTIIFINYKHVHKYVHIPYTFSNSSAVTASPWDIQYMVTGYTRYFDTRTTFRGRPLPRLVPLAVFVG